MSSESLLELAKSRAPADRERLLLGIVELCDAGDGAAAMISPQIQALLNSIFLGLVAGAEREIRKRLALCVEKDRPGACGPLVQSKDQRIGHGISFRELVLFPLNMFSPRPEQMVFLSLTDRTEGQA